jgi:hypothetical protein
MIGAGLVLLCANVGAMCTLAVLTGRTLRARRRLDDLIAYNEQAFAMLVRAIDDIVDELRRRAGDGPWKDGPHVH